MDESKLDRLLFSQPSDTSNSRRPLPDWWTIHQELKGKSVTLGLLWEEYKSQHPNGYQYSQFCELYRRWRGKLDLWMRQPHKAGEKLFVDYCGQTVPVVSPSTGEVNEAEIFVAVMGASNYTFSEATWTQTLPDWIGSHQRAFHYFGGLTELVVIDNLKSGVTKACRYEPDLNPTYQDMATHYGTAVIPARVRKPKDKAKVEAGVQFVERQILARLRNRTFFGLDELNDAITELLEELNNRPFQKLPGCRRSLFESLDKPVLKPLPATAYQYAEWKKPKVNIDYHVEVDWHYYSVPYQLVGKRLDVRITATTVECFNKGKRVASHRRSFKKGGYTTLSQHMPKSHREYLKWTPDRLENWAAKTGPHTARLAKTIIESRPHPQQGFRSVLGILRLTKTYGDDRIEAACKRALSINSPSYKSVKSILKNGLDQKSIPQNKPEKKPVSHPNIRGAGYYTQSKTGGEHAQSSNRREAGVDEAPRHEQGSFRADKDAGHQVPLL